jgi:hypothetical protein
MTDGAAVEISPKSKGVLILLSAFGGSLGLDRFYMGQIGLGILKLITAGGCVIWALIDTVLHITGEPKDAEGRPIVDPKTAALLRGGVAPVVSRPAAAPSARAALRSAADTENTGSNRNTYIIAVLVMVIGLGLDAWFVYEYLGRIPAAMQQVVVPGHWEITLPESGSYTIFHETQSTVGGRRYTARSVPGLKLELTSKDGARRIPLISPTAQTTYTFSGRSGVSLMSFTIDRPGPYVLSAEYAAQGPQTVLAIGRFGDWFFWVLTRAIAIAAITLVIGGAIIVRTFLKARRAD